MLGARVSDIIGSESAPGTTEPGLHLLPVETSFASLNEKTTQRCVARLTPSAARGLFAHLHEEYFSCYQIHVGRTIMAAGQDAGTPAFVVDAADNDGWLSANGWCAGGYLHGLFENDNVRHAMLRALSEHRSAHISLSELVSFNRQTEYDKLADWLRQYLNIQQLKELCDLL